MARLILVRHGETDYNSRKRYCGFSDPSLNDAGTRQCRELAVRLKNMKVDRVYSSDLKRAHETAEIIFGRESIKILPDLREMNFGIFEGLTHEELMEKYPDLYRSWIDDPFAVAIPSGERLNDFVKRVMVAVSSILSDEGNGTAAVVTHGGPIRIILRKALKKDPGASRKTALEPGEWIVL